MTQEGRASDDDADMFDVVFAALWKKLAIGIKSDNDLSAGFEIFCGRELIGLP